MGAIGDSHIKGIKAGLESLAPFFSHVWFLELTQEYKIVYLCHDSEAWGASTARPARMERRSKTTHVNHKPESGSPKSLKSKTLTQMLNRSFMTMDVEMALDLQVPGNNKKTNLLLEIKNCENQRTINRARI